ncbi:Protein kinase-like domain [Pseudocohnilembus persalinus]|uniref:non-specific serine/threonine protein kinase n=1 Tax=Pseudocohnilembus persalinus TaxID=266149 RepID=A0A0V0R126_PSEPJ|nr:Protein kinase-like domain [Pseudocohnilembus persalinus]|eukprot:KRX08239.1 Protein kinase-like domain [Pseudocohnilembus persalinus]
MAQKQGSQLQNYEVIQQIGKGSFGIVCKIKRKTDEKIMVWKELTYGKMSDREKQQLVSEVNIIRELKNPNIVRYYDRIIDKKEQKIYIIMEYCEGGDMGVLLKKCKKEKDYIAEDVIWKIFTQILTALNECHNRKSGKILHRDLKPANIFLDSQNNIKLGDFGLSKLMSDQSVFAYTHVGTPYYMSPEQINEAKYNEKSDIWSAGCLLYEMAALRPPFEATNHLSLAIKIKAGKFERLPMRYSEELQKLCQIMIQIDQNKRPNVEQLLQHPQIALRIKERQLRERHVLVKQSETEKKTQEQQLTQQLKNLEEKETKIIKELKEKIQELENGNLRLQNKLKCKEKESIEINQIIEKSTSQNNIMSQFSTSLEKIQQQQQQYFEKQKQIKEFFMQNNQEIEYQDHLDSQQQQTNQESQNQIQSPLIKEQETYSTLQQINYNQKIKNQQQLQNGYKTFNNNSSNTSKMYGNILNKNLESYNSNNCQSSLTTSTKDTTISSQNNYNKYMMITPESSTYKFQQFQHNIQQKTQNSNELNKQNNSAQRTQSAMLVQQQNQNQMNSQQKLDFLKQQQIENQKQLQMLQQKKNQYTFQNNNKSNNTNSFNSVIQNQNTSNQQENQININTRSSNQFLSHNISQNTSNNASFLDPNLISNNNSCLNPSQYQKLLLNKYKSDNQENYKTQCSNYSNNKMKRERSQGSNLITTNNNSFITNNNTNNKYDNYKTISHNNQYQTLHSSNNKKNSNQKIMRTNSIEKNNKTLNSNCSFSNKNSNLNLKRGQNSFHNNNSNLIQKNSNQTSYRINSKTSFYENTAHTVNTFHDYDEQFDQKTQNKINNAFQNIDNFQQNKENIQNLSNLNKNLNSNRTKTYSQNQKSDVTTSRKSESFKLQANTNIINNKSNNNNYNTIIQQQCNQIKDTSSKLKKLKQNYQNRSSSLLKRNNQNLVVNQKK